MSLAKPFFIDDAGVALDLAQSETYRIHAAGAGRRLLETIVAKERELGIPLRLRRVNPVTFDPLTNRALLHLEIDTNRR